MKSSKQIERWLRQINAADEPDISCSECFDQVSGFIDRQLEGDHVAEEMPALVHHLANCGVCREEYETLLELASQDKDKETS